VVPNGDSCGDGTTATGAPAPAAAPIQADTGYSDDLLPPPNMTLTPLDAVTAKLICFCCKQSM